MPDISSQVPTPDKERQPIKVGSLVIKSTHVGAVIALATVTISWFGIPAARPFIVGSVGLGVILGTVLWWKRR
jgi:hypothetical protein